MFTVFKKILNKGKITDEDLEKVNEFVMCRWLSGSPQTIQIAQMLNIYYKMPLKAQVLLIQSLLGGKVRFIPYPKSEKVEDNLKETIDALCFYYNFNEERAREYISLSSTEELEKVVATYKIIQEHK